MRVLFDTDEVRRLLTLFEVAPVNRPILEAALAGAFADFEDAVIYEAARHVNAQAIVTRNTRDFKQSVIPIHPPSELVHILQANRETGA